MKVLIVPYVYKHKHITDLHLKLDDDIFDDVAHRRLHVMSRIRDGDEKTYYFSLRVDGKQVGLHRYTLDARPGQIVDHKSRDTLDCQRSNLRAATMVQNSYNRVCKDIKNQAILEAKSGFSVCLSKQGVIYTARYFATKAEAVNARRTLGRALFGEFSPYE